MSCYFWPIFSCHKPRGPSPKILCTLKLKNLQLVGFFNLNFNIHSFWNFCCAFSSPLLLGGTPDYRIDIVSELTCRSSTVKDFLKVPTWRPKWASNVQPSGRRALNLPLSHQAPQ